MKRFLLKLAFVVVLVANALPTTCLAQKQEKSVVGEWIEEIIKYIPADGQGPTIHARNMFHASVAMYDAWAFYEPKARPYLLGNQLGDFKSELKPFDIPEMDRDSAQHVALSYAVFRVMEYRLNLYGSP